MDPITSVILEIAKTLGVPPVTAAILIPVGITLANRAARLIPDTATGPLKWLRVAFQIIGIHVKDNSGVPAKKDTDGTVIRRDDPDMIPEDVQGALALDDTMRLDPFGRGANALSQKED